MLTFLDGPAKDASGLCLRRAPLFLRLVQDADGEWDALDQLADSPAPAEKVYAYRRASSVSWVYMLLGTSHGRSCSWLAQASYQFVPEQPPDEVLRDTASWRAWTREQIKKEKDHA